MRLDRLDLARYGRFTDTVLDFPAPTPGGADLHVIFGPNEAGKSTIFSAWLDLLFGIPLRSRYDFLHPGPTMRIGATIRTEAGPLALTRIKRGTGSLLDAHGAALPETVLQAALGGLGREGYGAMFSLDDDTLERGGESILASRGDLGEMLFSASAGLAGLGPELEAMRADLDAFHAPGKRKGAVREAKARLAELDRARRDLDTSAAAAQKLAREVVVAEDGWTRAKAAADAADAALAAARATRTARPLRARLVAAEAELAPLAALPEADPALDEQLRALTEARIGIDSRLAAAAAQGQTLGDRLAALAPDPAVLALATDLAAAEGLRAAHDTALADLPHRIDAAQEIEASLRATQAALGQAGVPVAGLLLSPARLASLRALLARRSGHEAAVAAARAEAETAQTALAEAEARRTAAGAGSDARALTALLAQIGRDDPAAALALARRAEDLARADLAQALAALAPWRGDAEALAALAVPAPWQLAAWQAAAETTRATLADATRALAATAPAPDETAAAPAADADAARSRREALWAAHLATLTHESARAFEAALRADDRITAEAADRLAAARLQVRAAAARDRATAALSAAQAARTAHLAEVAAVTEALGLSGAGLDALLSWLSARETALAAQAKFAAAEAETTRASAAVDAAAQALAALLGQPVPAPGGFAALRAEALARVEAAGRIADLDRAAEAARETALRRAQALAQAAAQLAAWDTDWAAQTADTPLAAEPIEIEGLGRMLDLLERLGQEAASHAALADRIAKMEANRDRFRAALADLRTRLGMGDDAPWTALTGRLRRAEEIERQREGLGADLAALRKAQDADSAAQLANEAGQAGIAAHLGAPMLRGRELAAHLAACRRASALRSEIARLTRDLAAQPEPEAGDDDDATLAARESALQGAAATTRAVAEESFAALREARRRLEAVGGDDAVARIEAERANLLNALAEDSRAHLAARFGLIAFETALRRYRDSHRSAMLARASEAFAALSRGAYAGLSAEPDGAQERLVALPAAGGAKLAADLSKGTRFQLYLALRIAGYAELARSRPTVPFVADDIMETFDDGRATAAFTLLGQMSHHGQVIYLTHHRHLCEIAREACPQARVLDLTAL
ncbi:chromosome segregation protein SMC [Sinirhodobacter ferrireducens]|uniref:Chromosome segregation protein SMC n=1 Tax=Paenirhodobacter ferrireducens TaxID=1215032 RepID=A0A443LTH5_9RHOB|nr:YhaN family protein [Sinirhodobacter ferrireducens]RWR52475.1 chromosome segregation protein SMC [Sinirhodobacter ferrireducens]